MTTYLVTRHEGTRIWATAMAKHGRLPFVIDRMVEHFDPSMVNKGDVVVGTLPIHVVAELHARKVEYWALDLQVPPEDRGKELSGLYLAKLGASFTRYEVRSKHTATVEPQTQKKPKPPGPSITLIPVSDHLVPAAIAWRHRPTDQVRLLASPDMQKKAKVLEGWLRGQDPAPKVSIVEWQDTDYALLVNQAEAWAADLALEDRPHVVVQLTGGTKPMSMALQRAFDKRAEAFQGRLSGPYVDTHHQKIEELLVQDHAATPMRAVLNIADQLALQGMTVESATSASPGYQRWLDRNDLFQLLMSKRASDWLPAWYALLNDADWLLNPLHNPHGKRECKSDFSRVEWLGSTKTPQLRFTIENVKKQNWAGLSKALKGEFNSVLQRCGAAEIAWDKEKENVFTISLNRQELDELEFLRGGWMELWMAREFAKAGADDWVQGLEIKKDGVKNELDLVVAAGNKLLLVEVKTGNLTKYGKEDSKATETVYKLDSVAEKFGHYFNKRWLVSLKDLNEADRKRAEKHKIRVFSAAGCQVIRAAISEWIAKTALPKDPSLQAPSFRPGK